MASWGGKSAWDDPEIDLGREHETRPQRDGRVATLLMFPKPINKWEVPDEVRVARCAL
jgi:hypothetical protein